jgi:hypothetical protein
MAGTAPILTANPRLTSLVPFRQINSSPCFLLVGSFLPFSAIFFNPYTLRLSLRGRRFLSQKEKLRSPILHPRFISHLASTPT